MTDRRSNLTVVIPTYRGIGNLQACLNALTKSAQNDPEIIIVDCETPEVKDWLRSSFPGVKLLQFERDIGLGRARNEGIRISSPESEYIAFLDNDTIVRSGWADLMIKALESEPSAGAAQSCILLAEEPNLLDHTGLALDMMGTWDSTQGLPAKPGRLERRTILCASTAAAMVRREVFEEIGGFDPEISVCDEDTDLSWRVWLSGRKVIFVPEAVAYHSRGLERDLTLKRIYHSVRNRPYILLKNSEGLTMTFGIFLFGFLSLVSAVALVALRRNSEACQVFSAVGDIFRSFPKAWKAHMRSLSLRKTDNLTLFSKGLLRRDISATIRDISSKMSSFRGSS